MEAQMKETVAEEETAQTVAAEPVEESAPAAPLTPQERRKKNARTYTIVAFLYGLVCSTIPIVITELIWDRVVRAIGIPDSLGYSIFADYFRASFIEEGFKFLGFALAFRHFKFGRQIEAIIAAGIVGFVYGVVEKAVLFNVVPLVLGLLMPMHTLWQLNRGRQFFAYREALSGGEKGKAVGYMLLSTLLIFVIHGTWDALLDVTMYLNDLESLPHHGLYAGLVFAALIAYGVIYTVFTIIFTVRVARKDKVELPPIDEQEVLAV